MTKTHAPSSRQATLTVTAGTLRGTSAAGIETFRAVPYAAAPVADRRFSPPAASPVWADVRDAIEPGANTPQRVRPLPGLDVAPLIGTGWRPGDDYLTLDVLRREGGTGRPIIVFIHGGGFVIGAKDAPVQRGESFARDGIAFVSINYRLGIDGFLPIPGVPTNLGLRDMIAALAWVSDNAAALGGDVANVTVFGESAGAMAIANPSSHRLRAAYSGARSSRAVMAR